MELALTIFRLGVGIGALLVGIGVVVAVLALRPVIRDTRALANDARRLVRLTEADLPAIVAHARELTVSAEELSADLAVVLERLEVATQGLEGRAGDGRGRPPIGPVQSSDAREDERIA